MYPVKELFSSFICLYANYSGNISAFFEMFSTFLLYFHYFSDLNEIQRYPSSGINLIFNFCSRFKICPILLQVQDLSYPARSARFNLSRSRYKIYPILLQVQDLCYPAPGKRCILSCSRYKSYPILLQVQDLTHPAPGTRYILSCSRYKIYPILLRV